MTKAQLALGVLGALAWPVTTISLALLFKQQVAAILERITHASLPGGVSFDFGQEAAAAKALSEKTEGRPTPADRKVFPAIPLTQANARMISLGLRPSPSGLDMSYCRSLANQDPNVALAGLRIE